MAKIDDIYDAVDDYGLITSLEARNLGVSNSELVQYATRNKLVRMARGVYRVPVWPYQEHAPYAIAVKAAGPSAYLYGESVVALLALGPTDPRVIWVASPKRIRRHLGGGIRLVTCSSPHKTVLYEGIPCLNAGEALVVALPTMGANRTMKAGIAAERLGYISHTERLAIEAKARNHGSTS